MGHRVLPSVEYSVTIPVPIDVAFRGFQDVGRLLNRGVYDEAVWTEGTPWQVGSRVRYVIVQPIRATISAVVTAISPPRSVDMLNHALGVTAEQHVSFGPDLKGGTRVRITMALIGRSEELSENELHQAAAFLAHDALDSLVVYCERRNS